MQKITFAKLFALLSIGVLLLKVPTVGAYFGFSGCNTCSYQAFQKLYIPAIAYFSVLLIAITFIPAAKISKPVRLAGTFWSITLAFSLTYLSSVWCLICLTAHTTHIATWFCWRACKTSAKTLNP